MGVYSSSLKREVRMERMRPEQLDQAIAERPAIYVPTGSIEWHGRQNPVGLDATKAHEQLVGLAARAGGVVHPPIFYSSGGGHADFPHSYMFDPAPIKALMLEHLRLFERNGFKAAILLSGHGPNSRDYLQPALDEYHAEGGAMKALMALESQAISMPGALHAGKWETSLQLYLHPETVDMDAIAGKPDDDIGPPDEKVNWMGDEFKDHPCYGVWGIDPRAYSSAEDGRDATECLIQFYCDWLDEVGV